MLGMFQIMYHSIKNKLLTYSFRVVIPNCVIHFGSTLPVVSKIAADKHKIGTTLGNVFLVFWSDEISLTV